MKLSIRNQICHLLPEKAVFWEEEKALIVADMHIGKGTLFRKSGIFIPQGILANDLRQLMNLITEWQAEKCIIVGDFIHAHSGLSDEVKKKVGEGLHKLSCEVHLIIGNHDRSLLKYMPPEWPINIHENGLILEPFYFSHFPKPHESLFVWSGHLHPKIEIKNAYDRLVLRCFQVCTDSAILPAFGFFVGGTFVQKSSACKIYAIADNTVLEV